MIAQLGDPSQIRKELIKQKYTLVEIDGKRTFKASSIESVVSTLKHFNPNMEYKIISCDEEYKIYNRQMEGKK